MGRTLHLGLGVDEVAALRIEQTERGLAVAGLQRKSGDLDGAEHAQREREGDVADRKADGHALGHRGRESRAVDDAGALHFPFRARILKMLHRGAIGRCLFFARFSARDDPAPIACRAVATVHGASAF